MAFLKAIPELVGVVKEISGSLKYLADQKTERETSEAKQKIDMIATRLRMSNGNPQEVSDLIRDLNSIEL